MRDADDYLALIPPLNASKPNFMATIAATVAPFADAQTFLAGLSLAFDLDVAIGAQLDVVGQWIGRSRNIVAPISNVWFSWGIALKGWGEGFWYVPESAGTMTYVLDDTTYRRLLRAKILANNGDGTIVSAEAALREYFIGNSLIFLVDASAAVGQINPTTPDIPSVDMIWNLGVAGALPTIPDLEILAQNLIPIKPAGVALDVSVVTVDGAPLFGWGLENAFVSGWGVGAWGASPDYVIANVVA